MKFGNRLIASLVTVSLITIGVIYFIGFVPFSGSTIVTVEPVDPSLLADITEELSECYRNPMSSPFHCAVDEFSFSRDSYEILETGHRQCEQGIPPDPLPEHSNPSKVLRLGQVNFLLESDSFPYPNLHDDHCEYNITIHYRQTGAPLSGHFPFQFSDSRYDFTLTRPITGRPIAGMIYDNETNQMFYLLTKMIY